MLMLRLDFSGIVQRKSQFMEEEMKTPIIETERMILRPLSVMDANDIYERWTSCLLYTSDAADELDGVDLGGGRWI